MIFLDEEVKASDGDPVQLGFHLTVGRPKGDASKRRRGIDVLDFEAVRKQLLDRRHTVCGLIGGAEILGAQRLDLILRNERLGEERCVRKKKTNLDGVVDVAFVDGENHRLPARLLDERVDVSARGNAGESVVCLTRSKRVGILAHIDETIGHDRRDIVLVSPGGELDHEVAHRLWEALSIVQHVVRKLVGRASATMAENTLVLTRDSHVGFLGATIDDTDGAAGKAAEDASHLGCPRVGRKIAHAWISFPSVCLLEEKNAAVQPETQRQCLPFSLKVRCKKRETGLKEILAGSYRDKN